MVFTKQDWSKVLEIDPQKVRIATPEDLDVVSDILGTAFQKDPVVSWIVEKSKHPKKFELIQRFLALEALKTGFVLINQTHTGAAIWKTEQSEKMSFEFILRNFEFVRKLGLHASVRGILDLNHSEKVRTAPKFLYLAAVGLLPEYRGQGEASLLLDPGLDFAKKQKIPCYLETGNPKNKAIYEHKGFQVTEETNRGDLKTWYMKKEA